MTPPKISKPGVPDAWANLEAHMVRHDFMVAGHDRRMQQDPCPETPVRPVRSKRGRVV